VALHSFVKSPQKKAQIWLKTFSDSPHLILGVRRAVFAPCKNLGLIIVDEEHDSSYKTHDQGIQVHIRDAAVMRAYLESAMCLLGSATPSLETMFNLSLGRYKSLPDMKQHHTPHITYHPIDAKKSLKAYRLLSHQKKLKGELIQAQDEQEFSNWVIFPNLTVAKEIIDILKTSKAEKKQSLILMNRKGSAHFLVCLDCGTIPHCPRCSTVLTYYQDQNLLFCKRCLYKRKHEKECSSCSSTNFIGTGSGSERLFQELKHQCPDLIFEKFEQSSLSSQKKLNEILKKFREHEIDCLVGTQILTKGHDLPDVGLFAFIHLEDQFAIPDPRSFEKTVQMFIQAKGRVGRKPNAHCQVFYQAWNPDHPLYEIGIKNKYETFVKDELKRRLLFRLPPLFRDYLIHFQGQDQEKTLEKAQLFFDIVIKFWTKQKTYLNQIQIYGPFIPNLAKINQKYRVQIRLSSFKQIPPRVLFPVALLKHLEKNCFPFSIDVDSYDYR
jgi:primosomal protein N' (replication factor Y)